LAAARTSDRPLREEKQNLETARQELAEALDRTNKLPSDKNGLT